MSQTLAFTAESDGERLDRFLDARCPDFSRSRLQRLIQDGHVTLDGKPAKPSSRLLAGQRVTVEVPAPVESHLEPQYIPLAIAYQDEDVLVVDKPAGLTVHPAAGHPDKTLVNAVLALCPDIRGIGGTIRPGIVQRLDKDTSGLMAVAKNDAAHRHLSGQIKRREFTKVYRALVKGLPSPPEAVVDAPIGRDPVNRKRMAVVSGGREAATRYRTTTRYVDCSLLEVRTASGRTHQIRVHMASVGHPLVGDAVYGKDDAGLGRHFLHASVLGFRLPSTDEYAEFTSELPDELRSYLETLDAG